MAVINFDATNVPQAQSYEAMPAGWYNVIISASEMKPTKSGDGAYLALTVKVVDGPYAGRTVFHNLNLKNQNPVAVDIAYKQLSSICHATGIMQVADSQQLHDRPFQVKLKVKPAQGDYEAGNELSGFDKVNANPIVATKGSTTPAPAFAAPAAFAAPTPPPAAAPAPAAPAWQQPAAPQPWAQPAAPAAAPAAPVAPVAPAAPAWAPPVAPAAPVQPAWAPPVAAPAEQPAPQPAPVAAPAAPAAPTPPWAVQQ